MSGRQNNSVIARRLKPGNDLRIALEAIVEENQIKAGVLLSVVGSLASATIRTPSGARKQFRQPLELVSGTGTVGSTGVHVHISISDENGTTYGGHLLEGCIVRTTIELVIHDLSGHMVFDRVMDNNTGYKELVIRDVND